MYVLVLSWLDDKKHIVAKWTTIITLISQQSCNNVQQLHIIIMNNTGWSLVVATRPLHRLSPAHWFLGPAHRLPKLIRPGPFRPADIQARPDQDWQSKSKTLKIKPGPRPSASRPRLRDNAEFTVIQSQDQDHVLRLHHRPERPSQIYSIIFLADISGKFCLLSHLYKLRTTPIHILWVINWMFPHSDLNLAQCQGYKLWLPMLQPKLVYYCNTFFCSW